MIKYMTDMEIQLAQIVKELRMQVAALEVAMADLEDREWVGLTDEEIREVYQNYLDNPDDTWDYERAIEQALKEKNT
jgi:dimeric dUTPase (all-alpha-NTP-PPase superfamily)